MPNRELDSLLLDLQLTSQFSVLCMCVKCIYALMMLINKYDDDDDEPRARRKSIVGEADDLSPYLIFVGPMSYVQTIGVTGPLLKTTFNAALLSC